MLHLKVSELLKPLHSFLNESQEEISCDKCKNL